MSTDASALQLAPLMGDIPDVESISAALQSTSMSTKDTLHIDDIPDMDDDDEDENLDGGGLVEEEDDAAAKPSVAS